MTFLLLAGPLKAIVLFWGALLSAAGVFSDPDLLSLETSSNPDRVAKGRTVCWEPLPLVERPAAGTGREDPQPDTKLWFAVKHAFYAELRGEVKSKKPPLEGGLRVNPKP